MKRVVSRSFWAVGRHPLLSLTKLRAKPACPWAPKYRLIDIRSSNCIKRAVADLMPG